MFDVTVDDIIAVDTIREKCPEHERCDPHSNLFQVVKKSLSSLIHGSNPEIKGS